MNERQPTVPKSNVTMGRARASVAVAIAALVLIGGCTADKSSPSSPQTRQSAQPKNPQKILDEASKHVVDAGTGNFNISVDGMDVSIEGTYDLRVPYISQELTTHPPDLGPDGFKVRYVLIKKKVFARVSEGPFRKCWMRFTPSDLAAAQGVSNLGGLDFADLVATTPPAVEFLEKPRARGFAEGSSTKIKADVKVLPALTAAVSKAANALASKIDSGATAPAFLTVVDGEYSTATYTLGDLFGAAKIRPKDLKKAGLKTDDATPRQAFDYLAALEVQIDYDGFGQRVEINRPKANEIADVDFAALAQNNDTLSCKAAG